MKCIDICNLISSLSEETHISDTICENRKNAVVVTHCFDRNGAPMALFSLLKLLQNEYNFFVVSPYDGPLKEDFFNAGFCTFIGPFYKFNCDYFKEIIANVDLYICNTIVCCPYVGLAKGLNTTTLWWIHEAEYYINSYSDNYKPDDYNSPNIKIATSSKAAQNIVEALLKLPCENLPIPIADKYIERSFYHTEAQPVVFFFPASDLNYVKGIDVLMRAIISLPKIYHEKAIFNIAGKLDDDADFANIVHKVCNALTNVNYLGILPYEEIFIQNHKADCVIAPSRVDSLPATIIEGMMYGNIGVASTQAGISSYMTHAYNGFIFESENADELKKIIMHIIDHINELAELRINGRAIYETFFSPSSVTKKFLDIINIKI